MVGATLFFVESNYFAYFLVRLKCLLYICGALQFIEV